MMGEEDKWVAAMKAKGHMPQLDEDGKLDAFALEYDHHNGPRCAACDWGCCWHCDSIDDIPECDVLEGTCVVVEAAPLMIEGKTS